MYIYDVLSHFSRVQHFCNPMDGSPPASSVHGIFQARILEWVSCPSPWDLPDPEIKPRSLLSPAFTGRFFTTSTTREAQLWMEL